MWFLRLRHFGRFLNELAAHCWENEVLWPLPVMFVLFLAAAFVLVSAAMAPYIYTFF